MISIVIPAYNEEKRIGKSLRHILKYVNRKKLNFEVIIVDDGSVDKTVRVVKEISNNNIKIIKNNKNRGKGYSVKRGIVNAKYSLVLFSDSDLATPIEELDKFMEYIRDYDVVIASRNLKDSIIEAKQAFYRQKMGQIFPFLVNLIALNRFKDTQCGYDLLPRTKVRGFQLGAAYSMMQLLIL